MQLSAENSHAHRARPKAVELFELFIFLAIVAHVLAIFFFFRTHNPPLQFLLVPAALYALLLFGTFRAARKRGNVARWALLVLVVAFHAEPTLISNKISEILRGTAEGFASLLNILFLIIALCLLFSRSSNDWFRNQKSSTTPSTTNETASLSDVRQSFADTSAVALLHHGQPTVPIDKEKWSTEVRHNVKLGLIVEKLQPLGQKWVDKFAASYMALDNKSELPSLLRKIIGDARREHEQSRASGPTYEH